MQSYNKYNGSIQKRFIRVGHAIPVPKGVYTKIEITKYKDVSDRIALYETLKTCKTPDVFNKIVNLFWKIYVSKTGINPNNISINNNLQNLYKNIAVDFLEAEKECLNYINSSKTLTK